MPHRTGHRADRDLHAFPGQFLHQQEEALALAAQDVMLAGSRRSSKNSSEVSWAFMPILSRLRPRLKPGRLVSTRTRDSALRALGRVGLGDHDHQVGVLAVGDEGLLAVEHEFVAVAQPPWCARPAGRCRRRVRSSRWHR
jgi:hypothetical protein